MQTIIDLLHVQKEIIPQQKDYQHRLPQEKIDLNIVVEEL